MRAAVVGLGLGLVVGCGDKDEGPAAADTGGAGSGDPASVDLDGDGSFADEDCNDQVSSIYPGAPEICDGLDNDCDTLIDMDDPDVTELLRWHDDADGDSFGDPSALSEGCTQPAGTVDNSEDCDDTDADVHPYATEVCDDIDNDCDGLTDAADDSLEDGTEYLPDADGDGFASDDAVAEELCELEDGYTDIEGDCDDGDGDIYPGAPESCGDGVDSDCDGFEGLPSIGQGQDQSCAWAHLIADLYATGTVVGITDDLDGDGAGDLLFGGLADAAWVLGGVISGDTDIATEVSAEVVDSVGARDLGTALHWGDITADGTSDLIVGVPYDDTGNTNAGVAMVFEGPLGSTQDPGDAVAALIGGDYGDRAGTAVLVAGDLDGDGEQDAVVGAPYYNGIIDRGGSVYALSGPLTGDMDLEDADGRYSGERLTYRLGETLAAIGDTNGDGYDDVVAGASLDDKSGSEAGAAFVLLGPMANGDFNDTTRVLGEDDGDTLGVGVHGCGDVDGDGYAEVFVGAPQNDENGSNAGAAYVLQGPVSGDDDVDDYAMLTFLGEADDDRAGSALAATDLNGDGELDWVIGAPRQSSNPGPGRVFVSFGPQSGTVDLQLADLTLEGDADGDQLGAALAVGDHDGDGEDDLLVAAPYADTASAESGEAWLLLGGP